jgi:hypothetical protein
LIILHKTWYNKDMARPKKHPGGRPSDYKPEYADQAYKLCLLGYTDKKLADFFGVCEATINNWKLKEPKFLERLREGKELANATVADCLFQRACGYSHEEDKIFNHNGTPLVVPTIKHYPPDTSAAIMFLKNRQPDLWREKQEVEHSGAVNLILDKDDEQL